MKDVKSVIAHWLNGADYDWNTAQSLFRSKKYPYALFLYHLSIEKLLKSLLVKETKDHAPFTHNLVYLAGKLSIEFSKEQINLLEEMNGFNLEARYPDDRKKFYERATKEFSRRYKKNAEQLRKWLKSKF